MAETNYISSIKASDGKTYGIKDPEARIRMTEIDYASLKSLRDNSQLIPGMQYRIIDYNCTTTQEDTTAAHHQFDIIVTADSTNKLNEVARAIQHDGDVYFSNCNLAAWKIWYCLDNDKRRFAWADETNGTGVIYRMIDEFNNDCPYDFKNIMFKRYYAVNADKLDEYGYNYISLSKDKDLDYSINTDTDFTKYKYLYTFSNCSGNDFDDLSISDNCENNCIGNCYISISTDDAKHYKSHYLNNIVIIGTRETVEIEGYRYSIINNKFDTDCTDCTLINSNNNTICKNCRGIILALGCSGNTISDRCVGISFKASCNNNSIGTSCKHIYLTAYCIKNDIKDSSNINVNALLVNSTLDGTGLTLNDQSNSVEYNYITVLAFNTDINDNDKDIELSEYLTPNVKYPQFVGINSSGAIVSYTLDKIINK